MKFEYDDIVSICEAHGICLPVECVEMVVEITKHALASNKAAAVAVPGEEYQVKSDPIMCWETYQDRAVAQKHFDQLKADGCNAQFRVIYTAPIESPDGKINEPHNIRRPVAYVAPFDLDVLSPGHQESVKARLTRFPTRTRTVALYTTGHPAAAQPSRAEVLTDAARDVLTERHRQVSAEGWAPEHDDKHTANELSRAAACYAYQSPRLMIDGKRLWPWDMFWWKDAGYRRCLVKSGALILAEIERLDRSLKAKP